MLVRNIKTIFLVFIPILFVIQKPLFSQPDSILQDRNLPFWSRQLSPLPPDPLKEKKVKQVRSLLKKYVKWGRLNGCVLVVSEGKPIYQGSFGYADFKKKMELDTRSVFQLASMSKQFTAMAIMILEENQKLNYDHKVVDYISHFPYPNVTIRHLLNHTAGMPNYMWLIEHKWREKYIPYNDDVINLLAEQNLGPYFKPGTRFNYSNTGYIVLARIVELISGKPFHTFIKEKIFNPLKMKNSFVYSRSRNIVYNTKMVNSYKRRRGRHYSLPQTIHDGIVGDKGVYSTIDDLKKWDLALTQASLVSRATLKKAFTRLVLKNKYRWHYGFGFRIKGEEANKWVYHFGKWNHYHTYIGRFLDSDSTVIILSNRGDDLTYLASNLEKIIQADKKTNLTPPTT